MNTFQKEIERLAKEHLVEKMISNYIRLFKGNDYTNESPDDLAQDIYLQLLETPPDIELRHLTDYIGGIIRNSIWSRTSRYRKTYVINHEELPQDR